MECSVNQSIVVTILLPGALMKKLSLELPRKEWSKFLSGLFRYTSILKNASELQHRGPRKVYQFAGQNLNRLNIRIAEDLWSIVSDLSNMTGYSRCYLISFMIYKYLMQQKKSTVSFNNSNRNLFQFMNAQTLVTRVTDTRKKKMRREGLFVYL